MTERRRRLARRATASSALLLLLAVVSMIQMSEDIYDTYDPETNYVVKLEPGEKKTFEIVESAMLTALRENEGEAPYSELRLIGNDGEEVQGRSPNWRDPERLGGDDETLYSPVRVFENVRGTYTLHNDASASILWLVDDEEAANDMLSSPWTYLFFVGCCIGSPIGIIGLVLAVMVWTDKRKKDDQFVIIEDGRVVFTSPEQAFNVDSDSSPVPDPFAVEQIQKRPQEVEEDNPEKKSKDYWKSWDDG